MPIDFGASVPTVIKRRPKPVPDARTENQTTGCNLPVTSGYGSGNLGA